MSLIELTKPHILPDKTLLNLGCGLGQIFKFTPNKNHLYVDIWEPYLQQIKDEFSVVKLNIKDLSMFINKSWDYVVAYDVIEHLDKVDALKLIPECVRIARVKVMIYTPVGFCEQHDGKGWGKGNPEYQQHRCGFTVQEFKDLGFEVQEVKLPGESLGQLCIKTL